MIRVIILFIIFEFLFCFNLFAFQYEDYRWGDSIDNILAKLRNEKKIFSYTEFGLSYKDKIFDEPCEVLLAFSPKTQLLSFVSIYWDNPEVGGKISVSLSKKYGEFYNIAENIYFWLGPRKTISDSIYLNYSASEAKLIYFGEEYYEQYSAEKIEIYNN